MDRRESKHPPRSPLGEHGTEEAYQDNNGSENSDSQRGDVERDPVILGPHRDGHGNSLYLVDNHSQDDTEEGSDNSRTSISDDAEKDGESDSSNSSKPVLKESKC